MRQPITKMWFDESVKGWTFDQFQDRFKDQLTPDEILNFADKLGIKLPSKSERKADKAQPGPSEN